MTIQNKKNSLKCLRVLIYKICMHFGISKWMLHIPGEERLHGLRYGKAILGCLSKIKKNKNRGDNSIGVLSLLHALCITLLFLWRTVYIRFCHTNTLSGPSYKVQRKQIKLYACIHCYLELICFYMSQSFGSILYLNH